MSNSCCRLCFSSRLTPRLSIKNGPKSIQRLLTREELAADTAVSFDVQQCEDCGLVQLPELLTSDYYDDYVMTTSHSPQVREYQREQARAFVSRFQLPGKRIIDIGCGDGNYMQYLREGGAQAIGLEPSLPFRNLAQQRGFEVLTGYLGRNAEIPGAPYDAFVTRVVLEHVSDIHDFLQGARCLLTPGGVGLVEVPSLEKTFEEGRFYDFFPDHLNYFSCRTLRFALERNGFIVLEMSRGMNQEYHVALIRKDEEVDFAWMQETLTRLIEELRLFVHQRQIAGQRVAIWGAGGKGITILALAGISGLDYVVDSDPHKIGHYTPVSHLPICPPERLVSDPVDAVIISAITYLDEIYDQVRHDLQFKGDVAALGHTLRRM